MNTSEAARRERETLAKEIERNPDPRYARLQMLDEIIAKLGGAVTQKGSSKKDTIHNLAVKCIREQGGYAKLADIFAYVVNKGVKVSQGTVKAYMYDYKDLRASRTKGWSIK